MNYDVVIVGAGITGSMLARELSKYALSVVLLEKGNDVALGASCANSGIIHGGYDPIPGTLKAQLNAQGVELLFEAAAQLNVPHLRNGSLVCAFSAGDEQILEELYAQGIQNGITGMQLLSGDEARQLEPYLSGDVTRALRVTNAGIISPYELTIAAAGNAMDNGVELKRNFEVCAIDRTDDGFTVLDTNGQKVTCKFLVNCAGCYSDAIAALAGDGDFKIIPRAGEYMLLDKAEGFRTKHTLFQCPGAEGKGILVSPTVHGNLLVGPTASCVPSPDDKATTPEGLAQVKRLSAKTVPSVDFRQVITSFSGVRASEKSGDFILRASERVPGLIHAGAIDSPGLTCCVSIAKYLVGLLHKQGLTLKEKKVWDGTRKNPCAFRDLSDEEKDAQIRKDPAFGKIICRCEGVSEGEILQAIRMNPRALDVDSVKRRTRSGIGRCQGGFCAPYVMQLLSKELGIGMEEITKSGQNSKMLSGRIGV